MLRRGGLGRDGPATDVPFRGFVPPRPSHLVERPPALLTGVQSNEYDREREARAGKMGKCVRGNKKEGKRDKER